MAGLNPSGTLNIGSTNTRYTSIGKNHAIVADHETDKIYFNGYEVPAPTNTVATGLNSYTVAYDYVIEDPTKAKFIGVSPADPFTTNTNTDIVNNLGGTGATATSTFQFTKPGTYQFTYTVVLNSIPTTELTVGFYAKSPSTTFDSITGAYLPAETDVSQSLIKFESGGSDKVKVKKFNIYVKDDATLEIFIKGGSIGDKIMMASTLTIKEI